MKTPKREYPKRVQISRQRKDPPDTIRVTRMMRKGKRIDKFGNNYVVGKLVGHTHSVNFDEEDYNKYGPHSRKGAIPVPAKEEAVRLFVKYQLPTYTDEELQVIALKKHVGCWCQKGEPCHGDEYIKEIERRKLLPRISCKHPCGPSDWYKGGKCDKNGCYYG